jgi:hypothetical protein
MVLAKLSGALDLWTVGPNGDRPEAERDAVLLGYTSSPAIWGVLLGRALRRVDLGEGSYAAQVDFCRRVVTGDSAVELEAAARTHLKWLRNQPGL